MQYSIINGKKLEAQPNLIGTCICCDKPTYSACGNFNTWHWRHKNKKECDNWWEPETEWHRKWKSNFPENWREVVHFDSQTGEKHIADIKTNKGVVLEFQNSPITFEEVISRELFYKKLIWIINGNKFKNNFEFGYKLPDPKSNFPPGFKFLGYKHIMGYNSFKYPTTNNMVELINKINGIPITQLIDKYHSRHFTFNWKNKRQVWFKTQMPVFIDFNDGVLWRIIRESRLTTDPICGFYSKKEFINHYTS